VNSDAGGAVEVPKTKCSSHLPSLVLLATLAGCVEIDGGAIELSWTLRTFDGAAVPDSCMDESGRRIVEDVRLCWASVAEGESPPTACPSDTRATFRCPSVHGVTGFEVAEGPTAIWIEPVCTSGEPAASGSFQVPAPIVRDVVDGKVVTLNSLLVVVGDETCAP
jgi:hypothetical protein